MEYSKEREFRLIEDILNGDREKYRILVDRYSPMIFYIASGYVNDEAVVEELAQQIFVKCYERLVTFRMNARFSSWLYSLANNHCRDYAGDIRRNNSRFSELAEHEFAEKMASGEAADKEIQQSELQDLLNVALQHITYENAEAFLLKYRDNMTYKVMSERLGVSVAALKVRVHRARKELKKYLENGD